MTRALLLSICLLATTTAVRAEQATALPAAEQESLDAFATAHKDCNVWSDGCVICRRLQETAFACSTPGIACQPKALACQPAMTEQKPAEASKPTPPATMPKDAH